jgi:Rieske Fe-S protein
MTLQHNRALSQARRLKYRGQTYSSSCLACTDFINCCGSSSSNQFDGATPPNKKPGLSRRDFLKIMGGVSAVLAAAPFVAGGKYLVPQIPTTFKDQFIAKKSDVPVNGSLIYWFPFTTDPEYTNLLIHLPPELAKKAGNEFVSYNRTCIHLQCLVSFLSNSEIIGCPCHGSIYRPTDGWPIGGPAALIARYLPSVQLRFDGDDIYAHNIVLDEIGYGSNTPPSE